MISTAFKAEMSNMGIEFIDLGTEVEYEGVIYNNEEELNDDIIAHSEYKGGE